MIQLTKHKWSAIKLAHVGHTSDPLNYKVWQCRSISVSGYYIYILLEYLTPLLVHKNFLNTQTEEGQFETNLIVVIILFPKIDSVLPFLMCVRGIKYL